MTQNDVFYRPIWTVGRFSERNALLGRKHVAIMYNLIKGESNFFEDYSADVIRHVLAVGRNGCINIETVAEATGIDGESVRNFFQLLVQNGLLWYTSVFKARGDGLPKSNTQKQYTTVHDTNNK